MRNELKINKDSCYVISNSNPNLMALFIAFDDGDHVVAKEYPIVAWAINREALEDAFEEYGIPPKPIGIERYGPWNKCCILDRATGRVVYYCGGREFESKDDAIAYFANLPKKRLKKAPVVTPRTSSPTA